MPELPEVETIRRQLDDYLSGKKIVSAEVRYGKTVHFPAKKFLQITRGVKFLSVGRRAKLLLLNLSNGWTILTHLKMTGQYLISGVADKHVHVVFNLAGNKKLFFRDVRKFGYLKPVETKKLAEYFHHEGYGPEPLEREFTLEKFQDVLSKKRKSRLKQLFLDQKFLAGVGNIYAQEICFFASVKPQRKVGTLTAKEIGKLYIGLKKILRRAVELRGTSSDDYLDIHGHQGGYLKHLKVYGRSGKKCYRCGAILKDLRLGGRGTVYCAKCQK